MRDAMDKFLFSIRSCVVKFVKKMLKRCPLGSAALHNSVVFSPVVI